MLQQIRRTTRPNQKNKKRCWVRDIFKNRERLTCFRNIFHEMRSDRELFFRYFRMSPERFDHLLALVREQIEKEYIALRKSSPAAGRLVITLHYLASGETAGPFIQLSYQEKHCINRHRENM